MRALGAIAISVILASVASAEVFMTVYRCDGTTPLAPADPNTPHVYSDVMLGTRLVFVVSSDQALKGNHWWGGLHLTWDDWERGKLFGRGYDPTSVNGAYRDSALPAAGGDDPVEHHRALAFFVESVETDFNRVGFELSTNPDALAGDWFVVDYVAEKTGTCQVGLFDYVLSPDVPTEAFSFTHVPSRDFDGSGAVDFADFASLAAHWRQPVDPNAGDVGACDLNADQRIGPSDLGMFSEFWLERAGCVSPATEPNVPPAEL